MCFVVADEEVVVIADPNSGDRGASKVRMTGIQQS